MPLILYIIHHMPTDIGPTSKSLTLLCSHHAVSLAIHNLLMSIGVITLYTPIGALMLLVWPMSPTRACKPSLIPSDHLLTEEPMVD